MLISPIANLKISAPLSFKGASQTLGVKDLLPNPKEYTYEPLYTPFEESERKEKEYINKLTSLCISKDGTIHPLIKKHLDESKFIFELNDGKSELLNIKDAIKAKIRKEEDIDCTLYHATYTKETAKKILENGFRPEFISRTKFGPGFYFAFSEGDALQYNSAKLRARCKGKCANMDGAYYDKIATSAVTKSIEDFIGLEPCGYPISKYNYDVCTKILNEYVRNLFVNEFGYDLAYGSEKGICCIIAHNPSAISEIEEC